MADVYLAVQAGPEHFAKLVVQKRVRGVAAQRPDFGRRFLAEARLLARLSHPNLVQVLDLGWDAGGPFVVVEYLSGETLATALREMVAVRQGMPWPVVTRVAASLAAGLLAAHRASNADGRPDPILHRDLTPSNVVVCYSGAVKIIDFGIAKLAAEVGDTRTGMIKGKLSYLAPELLRGGAASPASDLFQLGVTLFEALTGRRLFDGPTDAARVQAVLHRPIPAPSDMVSGLPAALDRIVLQLLARDPSQRTGDADQVRAELEDVLRRSGQHVGEHEVGHWLGSSLPQHLSERLRRERECLRALAPTGQPPPAVVVSARQLRGRRIALAASGAALLAAAIVAVAVSSGDAAGPSGPAAVARPIGVPMISPLVVAPVVPLDPAGSGTSMSDAGPRGGVARGGAVRGGADPGRGAPRGEAARGGAARSDAARSGVARSGAARGGAVRDDVPRGEDARGDAPRPPRAGRRRPRRPREDASDAGFVLYIPLHPPATPRPHADADAGPDADAAADAATGADRAAGPDAGPEEPRTDNLDPWSR
jgi:tRNA A-37 threonylcarbamoyl transferase component Bud32